MPQTLDALIAEGRRHRALGELDQAVAAFTRAHELCPAAARPLVERGAILILQGRYEQTCEDYRDAAQLEPRYPGLNSYLAELCLYTNRAEDALTLSQDAAVLEPDNLMHRINIAHAQLLLGRTDAALNAYRCLAGEFHPTKNRTGRDLALQDLRLLEDAGIVIAQLEQARTVLAGCR
jgi:tetratricopeptide (TPR) repeat protein